METDRSGWLGSPHTAGTLLLLVPVATGAALSMFPNYDARPEYFAGWYPNIVNAGNSYAVSLTLLLAVAVLLVLLALALRRAPAPGHSGAMLVVVGGVTVSAIGFGVAALLGIPVWVWAGDVTDGALTMAEGAARSETWASTSQTSILLFGLGGLAVALTVLGVLAYRLGWTPPIVFWIALSVVVGIVVLGVVLTLFWVMLGTPPIIWTMMIGVSLLTRSTYPTDA